MTGQAIEVDGLDELGRMIDRLPAIAQAEIGKAGDVIVDDEARRIRAAGKIAGGVSALAASSVRARRGRAPGIVAGGAVQVDGDTRGGSVFFGAEFGGRGRPTTQQFRPWRGKTGYWFWPTIRQDGDRMVERWSAALSGIVDAWSGGGRGA